jgi:uncharacterized protein YraI
LWLVWGLSLVWLTLTPVKAQTPTPFLNLSNTIHVLTEREVVIRSGPGLDYTRIGRLAAEEEVVLTGRSSGQMTWLRLVRSGREGWIAGYSVNTEDDLGKLTQTTPSNPVQIVRPDKRMTVLALRTVNVRAEPSNQSEILTRLKNGDEVVVLGRSDERTSWLRLDLEGVEGWVAYFTVTLNGQASELPILDPETGVPVYLTLETPVGNVVAEAFRTVNVRSGPGIEYEQIGQLEDGDTLAVTGRSDSDNNWLLIEYENGEGWVAYFTVSVSGYLDNLPIVTVQPAE